MKVRERMLQMVRAMESTEEIRLVTAWMPEAITDVRRAEYPSCGRSLLYPRRMEMGALQSFDHGWLLDPPRTMSGM